MNPQEERELRKRHQEHRGTHCLFCDAPATYTCAWHAAGVGFIQPLCDKHAEWLVTNEGATNLQRWPLMRGDELTQRACGYAYETGGLAGLVALDREMAGKE